MSKVAVNVHVVILHGADAEEIVEWKRIELGDVENVGGELGGLFTRERARSCITPRENAIVRLRLENQKLGQRREKLEGAERFQLLLCGNAVGNIERVALLLVVGKVLLGPRIQVVMLDQVAALELRKARDGGEQIVVADDENLVGRTLGGIEGGQQDARGIVAIAGFAAAQILKMQEGFELVVKRGDFGGGYAGRKRQSQPVALEFGRRKSGISRGFQVQRPEAVVGVGAGRERQQRSGEAEEVSDDLPKEISA